MASAEGNCEFKYILMKAEHTLSPFYVHHDLEMCGVDVGSIHMAYWYAMLRQHGKPNLASALINNKRLYENPTEIDAWVRGKNFKIGPDWLVLSQNVYQDIVGYILNKDCYFKKIFKKVLRDCKGSGVHHFVLCTSKEEMVLACGMRYGRAKKVLQKGKWYPGMNYYGSILSNSVKKVLEDKQMELYFGVNRLLTETIKFVKNWTRTVLLVSDGQCRYIKSVEGGMIICRGRATYQDLVAEIKEQEVDLSDFRYIIVCAGFHDTRLGNQKQKESWGVMKALLLAEADRRTNGSILVCPTYPVHAVPKAANHAKWVTESLAGTLVKCVDWDKVDHPLDEGRLFLDNGTLHLNHGGTRILWKIWSDYIINLSVIPFSLSEKPYEMNRGQKVGLHARPLMLGSRKLNVNHFSTIHKRRKVGKVALSGHTFGRAENGRWKRIAKSNQSNVHHGLGKRGGERVPSPVSQKNAHNFVKGGISADTKLRRKDVDHRSRKRDRSSVSVRRTHNLMPMKDSDKHRTGKRVRSRDQTPPRRQLTSPTHQAVRFRRWFGTSPNRIPFTAHVNHERGSSPYGRQPKRYRECESGKWRRNNDFGQPSNSNWPAGTGHVHHTSDTREYRPYCRHYCSRRIRDSDCESGSCRWSNDFGQRSLYNLSPGTGHGHHTSDTRECSPYGRTHRTQRRYRSPESGSRGRKHDFSEQSHYALNQGKGDVHHTSDRRAYSPYSRHPTRDRKRKSGSSGRRDYFFEKNLYEYRH